MFAIQTVFRRLSATLPTLVLLCLELWTPVSLAQYSASGSGGGRMSVGSKWTRRPFSESNYAGQSNQSFGAFVPQASTGGLRYYGGTVVGNGLTVFPPGYFGAIYNYPGYGYSYGPSYIGASVSIARFGRLPYAYVPWVPPGFYGLPYAYPYDNSWPAVGPQAPVPIAPKEVAHAPAIPVATPEVRFDRGFRLQSPYAAEKPLEYADVRRSIVLASRNAALVDEFVATPVSEDAEPEELRSLESLRLQARGDKALQTNDLELARTLYQAAIAADPTQNGVWHRMAIVQLYQHDFDAAASSLKRVVTADVRRATEFIDLATLLGTDRDSARWAADQSAWAWLMERPASVDRLHLVAAWQRFTGQQERAYELVELATLAGAAETQTDMIRAILGGSVSASDIASEAEAELSVPALSDDEPLSVPDDTAETPPLKIPQS
jgi:tetratricopeptide (TPR) repeat protein